MNYKKTQTGSLINSEIKSINKMSTLERDETLKKESNRNSGDEELN